MLSSHLCDPNSVSSEQLVKIASTIADAPSHSTEEIIAASWVIQDMLALGRGSDVEKACDIVANTANDWASKKSIVAQINPRTANMLYTLITRATSVFPFEENKTASVVSLPIDVELVSPSKTILQPTLQDTSSIQQSLEDVTAKDNQSCMVVPYLFEHQHFETQVNKPGDRYHVLNNLLQGNHSVISPPPVSFTPGDKSNQQFMLLAYLIDHAKDQHAYYPPVEFGKIQLPNAFNQFIEFLLMDQHARYQVKTGIPETFDNAIEKAYLMNFYATFSHQLRSAFSKLGRNASSRVFLLSGENGIDEIRVEMENGVDSFPLIARPYDNHVNVAQQIASMTHEMGCAENTIFLARDDGENIFATRIGTWKGVDQSLLELNLRAITS